MTIRWVGADMLTGQILADLPGIDISGTLASTIGQTDQAALILHLDDNTNPDWLEATQPGGSIIIAYTGDPSSPTILWGGIVQQRVRDLSADVQLSVVSAETYLDSCYVGDYTATNANQDTIVHDLMAFASGAGQWQIALNHLPNASTQAQSVTYSTSDQKTILSALQDLSSVQGGPEWLIGWNWDVAASTITPVMSYGARIGTAFNPATMSSPNVTVGTKDLLSVGLTEDYSSGLGANQVICYGAAAANATGSGVPVSTVTATDTQGRPIWAYAFQPNSTVSDLAVLTSYAAAALANLKDGAEPISMTIPLGRVGKSLGVDWSIGDDIGWTLTGPAFPTPVSGTARAIGYQIDLASVTPILIQESS